MVFGLFKPKCAQCGMELGKVFYEWEGKKFCSQDCEKAYRKGSKKGGKCH